MITAKWLRLTPFVRGECDAPFDSGHASESLHGNLMREYGLQVAAKVGIASSASQPVTAPGGAQFATHACLRFQILHCLTAAWPPCSLSFVALQLPPSGEELRRGRADLKSAADTLVSHAPVAILWDVRSLASDIGLLRRAAPQSLPLLAVSSPPCAPLLLHGFHSMIVWLSHSARAITPRRVASSALLVLAPRSLSAPSAPPRPCHCTVALKAQ
jgi:hypothetical protein